MSVPRFYGALLLFTILALICPYEIIQCKRHVAFQKYISESLINYYYMPISMGCHQKNARFFKFSCLWYNIHVYSFRCHQISKNGDKLYSLSPLLLLFEAFFLKVITPCFYFFKCFFKLCYLNRHMNIIPSIGFPGRKHQLLIFNILWNDDIYSQ